MMENECRSCNAKCCRYFCFEIDRPDDFEQFEHVRWYLCHDGVTVHIEKGQWYISIANPCKHLDGQGRCTIYDDRPLICRKYSVDNCDYTAGEYDYEQSFVTAEDLEDYARKAMGPEKFERERDKALARLVRRKRRGPKRSGSAEGPGSPRADEEAATGRDQSPGGLTGGCPVRRRPG